MKQDRESLWERCQEDVESDPMDTMVSDEEAKEDFLIWLDNHADPAVFQKLLNQWLQTKDGQEFFERSVQKLFENRQNAGPEHED